MPIDLLPRRRRSLLEPLPYAGAVLLVAMLGGGYLALAGKDGPIGAFPASPVQTGRAVATPGFHICAGPPHRNCVMDGDTFYLGGVSIRIADIDAPEIHPARCASEAELGHRATHRLRDLLNLRPFEIRTYSRDTDMYGRKLRIVSRDGRSIGGVLVSEGLARKWTGKRAPWCG